MHQMDSLETQGREGRSREQAEGGQGSRSRLCGTGAVLAQMYREGIAHLSVLVSGDSCPCGIACNKSYPRARAKGHGGQFASGGGENGTATPRKYGQESMVASG